MDLTAQTVHSVPGAPLTQTDVSVVADEGLLTNVQAPSLTKVLNPTAIALDNPAGTGAPFDKKDSVYKVYQRWPEKSTFINGATGAGAELIRISLNPMTLPTRILDWVNFHQSCIPAIDVVIAIGGAAGTISWLTLGWLGDDQQEATLDDLQQVSCEHINMNNTAIMRFCLNDNRRSALYRTLPDDLEKWPCMVLMVNHPALNVQRNDDVNYPIDVYVRLAPNAIFMEPFNAIGGGESDVASNIDLSYYLKQDTVDILIGGSNVNNLETDMKNLPDAGYLTGEFIPHFTNGNLVCARCPANSKYKEVFYVTEGDNPPVEDLNEAWSRLGKDIQTEGYWLPDRVAFGFGEVPSRLMQVGWGREEETPPGGWGGTMYAIPEMRVMAGAVIYWCNQLVAYEFGCILILQCRVQARSNTFLQYDVMSDDWDRGNFFPFYSNEPTEDRFVIYNQQKGNKVFEVKQGPGFSIEGFKYKTISVRIEPMPLDRFYSFTYTLMSNNTPSSSMPVGTKTISIVRPGTTTKLGSSNTAFWPIMAPDLRGLKAMMEKLRKRLNTTWLQMDVEFNGNILGTIAYSDGVMACRCATPSLISVGLKKNIILRNIRSISNPSALNNFNLENFGEWAGAAVELGLIPEEQFVRTKPRFADIPMQRESAGLAIGGIAGLTNGIYDFFQQWQRNEWMKQYQQKQLDLMRDLEGMRGENARMLEDQRFRNRMAMLGINAPSRNNSLPASTQTGGSTTSTGVGTEPFPAPNPVTSMSTGVTTDIRGPENLNRPEYNRDNEFGRPPWMAGAVPTPFKQADNIAKGKPQGNVPDNAPAPSSTRENEEPLPGYAAFDPTSIGLPPEALEEFIRGDPKRTAFRVPNKQEEQFVPPIPPPMPERLLEPGTSGTQNFDRNDAIRQPIRRKEKATPEENLPMPSFERSLDHETQMPYDFLRYDDMRIGKRDFTGSKYAPQQFNRNDPLRQGARSYPQSTFGKQMFNRGDPARQPSRNISSEYFPPQQFIRGDVTRTARRDFSGTPFASATQTEAPAGPSTMTTERLL